MGYMRTRKVMINPGHPLFDYAKTITSLSNNLANAALFRERQVFTAVSKPENEWTANEREVMEEIRHVLPLMKQKRQLPAKGRSVLGSGYLYDVLFLTGNPDYFATGLPRQSAQYIVKQAAMDMFSFLKACRAYAQDPSGFTGKPKLPGYKRKGGCCTAVITNQDCRIKTGADGKWYAELPFIKKAPPCIGEPFQDARLKEVTITPDNGRFVFSFKFEVDQELPAAKKESVRICAVDFGVENLMAVTNNCGLPSFLYKGGTAKSANQLYNKTIARLVSIQTLETGKKFIPTPEYHAATNKRNDRVRDLFLKDAKHLVTWCVENRIDTIVLGVNKGWKQQVTLGRKNNQEFVQLPHAMLRSMITYLASWNGIRVIEQEESYTSKASFLDDDSIPVYQQGDNPSYCFSGKRISRGQYRSADGIILNADINGSANILRKAFPDAFAYGMPDLTKTEIIRHPDLESCRQNRRNQTAAAKPVSHAKQKRIARKRVA